MHARPVFVPCSSGPIAGACVPALATDACSWGSVWRLLVSSLTSLGVWPALCLPALLLCRRKKKWSGPVQYEDAKTGQLMMLPADMVLLWDRKFKKWVQEYANNEELFFKVGGGSGRSVLGQPGAGRTGRWLCVACVWGAGVRGSLSCRSTGPAGAGPAGALLLLLLPRPRTAWSHPHPPPSPPRACTTCAQDFAAAFSKLMELGVPFPDPAAAAA